MKTLIGVAVPAITFALLTTVGSDLTEASFLLLAVAVFRARRLPAPVAVRGQA